MQAKIEIINIHAFNLLAMANIDFGLVKIFGLAIRKTSKGKIYIMSPLDPRPWEGKNHPLYIVSDELETLVISEYLKTQEGK